MFSIQLNEFNAIYGSHHIISPIGYGKIMKSVIRGSRVRSAYEQFAIHNIAYTFESPLLQIPKPFELFTNYEYSMERIYDGCILPHVYLKHNRDLTVELCRFYKYMIDNGYFPYNYTIMIVAPNRFVLFDFSEFGSVSNCLVKFNHIKKPVSLRYAELFFGLVQLDENLSILDPLEEDLSILDPLEEDLSILDPLEEDLSILDPLEEKIET
jgi:hypothetical protein